ncbi:hypothetical protein SOVF_041370 isoform A [Spinacia oleracea]|uniref:Uncharacterized protein isoform X2 n=1 Tax=Spinacia oleracea TaxID=3562 RepID=A0A9R0HWH4_SPIOL|nr:uncharacterized protein LOC110777833 isoform X2 [Spinacia oleracea]KNA21635.1 hypothetical protein SOVF_041370 isoform A [Spinacia oleracea]
MAVVTQEPILCRLDRLDNLMRHLENIRGSSNNNNNNNNSNRSSSPSTPSSGTARNSDGHASSLDFFSPRSRDKLHCRPIDDVIVETEHKGTLLDRVSLIEHRLLKLEQEMDAEKQDKHSQDENKSRSPQTHKKSGLKQFVKSCVKGNKHKPNK